MSAWGRLGKVVTESRFGWSIVVVGLCALGRQLGKVTTRCLHIAAPLTV